MQPSPIRVAIVDDEAPVRKALARLLIASSFEAKTYGSAREFIHSIRSELPECLVLDIHMPDFTGLDLQRYLARVGVKIPTVVITAFNDPEIRERCRIAGVAAFLTKPLHGPTLIDAVKAAVIEMNGDVHD
ncbi:MAG TPA: response regulator [Pseudolabrys sp.]|nr:response regulator [Pseudolabrys sp.]